MVSRCQQIVHLWRPDTWPCWARLFQEMHWSRGASFPGTGGYSLVLCNFEILVFMLKKLWNIVDMVLVFVCPWTSQEPLHLVLASYKRMRR